MVIGGLCRLVWLHRWLRLVAGLVLAVDCGRNLWLISVSAMARLPVLGGIHLGMFGALHVECQGGSLWLDIENELKFIGHCGSFD